MAPHSGTRCVASTRRCRCRAGARLPATTHLCCTTRHNWCATLSLPTHPRSSPHPPTHPRSVLRGAAARQRRPSGELRRCAMQGQRRLRPRHRPERRGRERWPQGPLQRLGGTMSDPESALPDAFVLRCSGQSLRYPCNSTPTYQPTATAIATATATAVAATAAAAAAAAPFNHQYQFDPPKAVGYTPDGTDVWCQFDPRTPLTCDCPPHPTLGLTAQPRSATRTSGSDPRCRGHVRRGGPRGSRRRAGAGWTFLEHRSESRRTTGRRFWRAALRPQPEPIEHGGTTITDDPANQPANHSTPPQILPRTVTADSPTERENGCATPHTQL